MREGKWAKVQKPCPFCGGELIKSVPVYNIYDEKAGYRIVCHRCGAGTAVRTRHTRAVEAWDRRIGDDNEEV